MGIIIQHIKDTFPVATVIHSLLNEKDFQSQMGTEWVLFDGRKISKDDDISKYFTKLPDARGKFLRMADTDSGNDPDAPRILGSYQGDGFKSHNHSVDIWSNTIYAQPSNSFASGILRADNNNQGSKNFITDSIGSTETRPKNIAVNYFIKITTCKTTQCK